MTRTIVPGEILPASGEITLNQGRDPVTVMVANTGDRPIQVGSHYHFFEANAGLSFDRDKARGMFAGFRPKPGKEQGGAINTGAMSSRGDRSRERGAINTGDRSGLGNLNPERGPINTAASSSREMPLEQAVALRRYARAAADIHRIREQGLPVLPHQESALRRAGEGVDASVKRPHASHDLASALGAQKRFGLDRATLDRRRRDHRQGLHQPAGGPGPPCRAGGSALPVAAAW